MDMGTREQALMGAWVANPGQFEAVGQVGHGCTGTLITKSAVLTAAHCVCHQGTCADRAAFRLTDVYPVDKPGTPEDESLVRRDVGMAGEVSVHPAYNVAGWARADYAIIYLDQPVNRLVKDITPIRVAAPTPPQVGEPATLVGFGRHGVNCSVGGPRVKRYATLPVNEIIDYGDGDSTIGFESPITYVCEGDSGGPILNADGELFGVSSSKGGPRSYYDPTHLVYAWISAHACPDFDPSRPDPHFCSDPLCPCGWRQGDCDSDLECIGSLRCEHNQGASVGLPAHFDVCNVRFSWWFASRRVKRR